MANPSLTYTLTNGTTADADQVMQNFTDIINGITDGTKDLSIAALTAAGTATFNGNVTLGNASSDDITFTGSMASTLPIKTDATYDIGSTSLGLRVAYFGGNSNRVGIKASGSTSATWNLTLPTTAGTSGYVPITDGSGNLSWVGPANAPLLYFLDVQRDSNFTSTYDAAYVYLGAGSYSINCVHTAATTSSTQSRLYVTVDSDDKDVLTGISASIGTNRTGDSFTVTTAQAGVYKINCSGGADATCNVNVYFIRTLSA